MCGIKHNLADMKYLITGLILCCLTFATHAQNTFKVIIKGGEDKTTLPGATIILKALNKSAIADTTGLAVMTGIPNGTHIFIISHVGFEEKEMTYTFPLTSLEIIEIELGEDEHGHEEEVIVTATRISRTIANIPTRVEVISGEELTEKGNMRPGEIRMLLNESTGIQTQQTSATSFNAGIRIQGLEGRYTQLLRDGYPLYAGFSGGLSILQIAPLDLRQVEVIKGSASTLYGGGAIAGLVNLVSKTPGNERELSFLANGTSAGGLDLSGFYSQRYGKAGLTIFASRNSNKAFDPADIGLTAIPKFERYTINPRLFLYGKNTTADIGITYITEDRTGGSINYIKNGGAGFFEKNNTDRITTQLGIAHKLNEDATLQFKNSYSYFDRVITIPTYIFDALQQSSFSELTWNKKGAKADWVIGANLITEDLAEKSQAADPKRDYHYNTFGLFIQNAWSISEKFVLESGLRGDYVNELGFELLPRASAMVRVSPKITTRIGGGFGYKTPTIFTEEAERIQFRNLLPINISNSKNERSVGGNWDINYRTRFGDLGFSFNHLFFYTRLNNPLVLVGAPGGKVQFQNSTGHLDTKGMETNLRLVYGHFKLFVGYTYTDANTHFDKVKEWLPLTARHRLNNVLMYEIEDKLKIGLEAYHFSRQQLSDGSFGKPYWITGFMVEKLWEKFSLYINFENFTNTRQTRFDTIYTGTIDNPIFRDIYAPVEGFVVNGGIKLRL
jgi:outer membrane receptor for ferrienterochelin and colicins